jgi:hypothetical protein
MNENRRDFLKRTAFAAAASTLPLSAASADSAGTTSALPPVLNLGLLAALGDAVLPESLGAQVRSLAVRDFATWAAAYRPVSEEMHGYGDQEITYTAADPSPGWRSQLEALELLAHRKHRKGFASITVEQRRALVRPQLPRGRGLRLPANIVGAPHVAVALLAHWANTSAATDLAYGVAIGKDQCRVLADAPRRPLPLAENRGR